MRFYQLVYVYVCNVDPIYLSMGAGGAGLPDESIFPQPTYSYIHPVGFRLCRSRAWCSSGVVLRDGVWGDLARAGRFLQRV